MFWSREKCLAPIRIRTKARLCHSIATILNMLSWHQCKSYKKNHSIRKEMCTRIDFITSWQGLYLCMFWGVSNEYGKWRNKRNSGSDISEIFFLAHFRRLRNTNIREFLHIYYITEKKYASDYMNIFGAENRNDMSYILCILYYTWTREQKYRYDNGKTKTPTEKKLPFPTATMTMMMMIIMIMTTMVLSWSTRTS
jgi:hypothetical protein